jgi:transcriptional regulator with XRE-family HTH domain
MDSLGELVRMWREGSGLTLAELADRIGGGVKWQSLQQLEKAGSLRPRYLVRLAKAMGTTAEDLEALRMPPFLRGAGAPPTMESTQSAVAHELTPPSYKLLPTISWEQMNNMEKLPARFGVVLRDQAMAPKMPKGTELLFESADTAEPGQVALVRASSGVHVRQIRLQADGSVIAAAISSAWPTFDVFEVLAVARRYSADIEVLLAS